MKQYGGDGEVMLTFVTIATNKYLDMAHDLALSMSEKVRLNGSITSFQLHILTNVRVEDRNTPAALRPFVKYFMFPDVGWPEITLLRYRYLLTHLPEVRSRLVFWIDADMQMSGRMEVSGLLGAETVILAPHPGFSWIAARQGSKKPIFRNLQEILEFSIRVMRQRTTHLGDWELRHSSAAYVPRKRRMTYFHGAVWGGTIESVKKMLEVLSRRTDSDLKEGLIAVWHDESHLNWWAAYNDVMQLPHNFSAWTLGREFKVLDSIFVSVDKKQLGLVRRVDDTKITPLDN